MFRSITREFVSLTGCARNGVVVVVLIIVLSTAIRPLFLSKISEETTSIKWSGPHIKVLPMYEKLFSCAEIFENKQETAAWPPPCEVPMALRGEFSLGGRIPIRPFVRGCLKERQNNGTGYKWSVSYITEYRDGKKGECYGTPVCAAALERYVHVIKGSRAIVFGSQGPWAEAMLFRYGAKSVVTYEYMRIQSDYPNYSAVTPVEAALAYKRGEFREFDVGFSFSSFEHDGLGRYGDPLNPFGDFESVAKVNCLLKSGGIFFLGVPVGADAIEWNAHRIYGPARLPLLLSGWNVLDVLGPFNTSREGAHWQPIFVLQKKHFR